MRLTFAVLLSIELLAGCAPSDRETQFLARKARLLRQNQGIRELIAEEERGSLVPAGRFLIGIDEKIVGSLFSSQLPLERPLGKRFVVRLEKATVQFRDKYGLIIVEGVAYRAKTPQRQIAVRVYGGLGAVEIDPKTDLLTIRIAIDDIEILKAGILEGVLGRGGKKFLATQARPMLQDALPKLQVPVALASKIRVPSVQTGAIQLDSLVVPIDLSVERVIAASGKLWVTLHAGVGTIEGAEKGLGVAVVKKPRARPKAVPAPSKSAADSSRAGGGAR